MESKWLGETCGTTMLDMILYGVFREELEVTCIIKKTRPGRSDGLDMLRGDHRQHQS